MVTDTLRCRLPYYLYAQIDAQYPRQFRTSLRLLVRLISTLRPATLHAAGSIAPHAIEIARLTDSHITISPDNCDFIVLGHGSDPATRDLAIECYNRGGTVLLTDLREYKPRLRALRTAIHHGMTFTNGRTLIAVGRPDLPRQHFPLLYP